MSTVGQVAAQSQQKPALSAFQDPRSTPAPPLDKGVKEEEKPFELHEVAKSLHVYRPAPLKKGQKTEGALDRIVPPRVVLLLGWMDAPLPLLVKYAKPYATLFPQATIVVKLSNAKSHMNAAKSASLRTLHQLLAEEAEKEEQRRRMREEMGRVEATRSGLRIDMDKRLADKKALDDSTLTFVENENETGDMKPIEDKEAEGGEDVISSAPAMPSQPKGLLVHSFSDGGGNNLAHLLLSSSLSLAPRAVIFDSAPSQGRPWEGATALTVPLAARSRPWVIRVLLRASTRLLLYIIFQVILIFKSIRGASTRNSRMRTALNNAKLWPRKVSASKGDTEEEAASRLPPRLYLYSKADALVPYQAVEAHARESALAQGLNAAEVVDMEGPGARKHVGEGRQEAEDQIVGVLDVEERIVLRRWTNAAHCALSRHDYDGYWGEVRAFLRRNLRSEG